ncbi:alpha/beta hydrolase [Pseudoclavibacter soli]|uniref:alpha/beta hydrolase n=1 Tax=Pseudoclavibacter soli TaxID=452623 RepID=UPI000415F4B0|nr:alpha/beta hydrolase [Pseudoclavibacter soli]
MPSRTPGPGLHLRRVARRTAITAWMLAAAFIALAVIGRVAFAVSPWPYALLIRHAFDTSGTSANEQLAAWAAQDVRAITDLSYTYRDRADEQLDVYTGEDGAARPTIVWVHGGGWVGGDKSAGENHARTLAGAGVTVVEINYTLSPEATYPTAVHQLDAAVGYLVAHAAELGIDPDQLYVAGDSAGSQIAADWVTAVTSSTSAARLVLTPSISASQLRGAILFCGAYDAERLGDAGDFQQFVDAVLWAYTGERDWRSSTALADSSVIDNATADFVPTFISAGNGDPLLEQSQLLAERLEELGVEVDALFYDDDHEPALPHEYQMLLDEYPEAVDATERMLAFIAAMSPGYTIDTTLTRR